jgi:transcription elongation factor
LRHTLKSHLPIQQHFEPPSDSDSIEIGDYIQVLGGEHTGKRGIVNWFSKGDTYLWFRDILAANSTESSLVDLSSISVPVAMVQRTDLTQTITFTKERGYDVRPGDTVGVARGPEFGAKGLVQHVDIPNARLSLICDGDKSLVSIIHFNSNISDL